MPEPTVSKIPELVIFGGPLPIFEFYAISATIFYANKIIGRGLMDSCGLTLSQLVQISFD